MKRICKKLKYNGWNVEVWEDDKRDGTLSPRAWYVKHNGRWITQYEMRVRNYPSLYSLNNLFIIEYSDCIESLLQCDRSLLSKVAKEFNGTKYHQPVVLGIEFFKDEK